MEVFTSVPTVEEVLSQQLNQPYAFASGDQSLSGLNTISVGTGNQVMRMDKNGFFLGASSFASAPFSVDMSGNVIANSIKLATSGAVTGSGGVQDITVASTPTNVTGSFLNITLVKKSVLLFIYTASVSVEQNGTGNYGAYFDMFIKQSGSIKSTTKISGGLIGSDSQGCGGVLSIIADHYISVFNAGTYSFNLDAQMDVTTGTPKLYIDSFRFSYIFLGNA